MTTAQDLLDLEKKLLEKQEKIEQEQERLGKEKEKLTRLQNDYTEKLAHITHLTLDEAKQKLFEETEKKEAATLAKFIREKEEEAKQTADKKAKEILVDSMRHGAIDYIAEYTVSVVKI